jgi:hypothetical protein
MKPCETIATDLGMFLKQVTGEGLSKILTGIAGVKI